MAFTALETEIAALTGKVNSLYETYRTKAQTIDQSVANALNAIPNNSKTYYLNAATGADTNSGTSSSQPFRTLKAACDAVPVGGHGIIYLAAAPHVYDIDADIYLRRKTIQFRSQANLTTGNRPIIRQRLSADENEVYGFYVQDASVSFVYCALETATPADLETVPSDGLVRRIDMMGALVGVLFCDITLGTTSFVNRSSGTASMWLQIYGSTITRSTAGRGVLLNAAQQPAIFGASNNVLPEGLTYSDLMAGLKTDATGRVYNVLSSTEL